MMGVRYPLDDLLNAPDVDSLALLDCQRMITCLQLDARPEKTRTNMHDSLQQLRIGVPRDRGAEPAEVRLMVRRRIGRDRRETAEAVAADREPDAIRERLAISTHRYLDGAPDEEPFVIDDAGRVGERNAARA